jgi:hypothetical protein
VLNAVACGCYTALLTGTCLVALLVQQVFKAYPRSLPSLVLPLTNGTDVRQATTCCREGCILPEQMLLSCQAQLARSPLKSVNTIPPPCFLCWFCQTLSACRVACSVPAGPEQALVGVPLGLVSNVTVTSADADLIFTGV